MHDGGPESGTLHISTEGAFLQHETVFIGIPDVYNYIMIQRSSIVWFVAMGQ